MSRTILSQIPISSAELYDELGRIKARDNELGFRAQKTFDHLESIGVLSSKKAGNLLEKLRKLEIPRLRDQHFLKIVDMMPCTIREVKVALQQYNLTVSQENCKKIADVVAESAVIDLKTK